MLVGLLIHHEIKVSCLVSGVVVEKKFTPGHVEIMPESDGQGGTTISSWWEDDSWTISFEGVCDGKTEQMIRTVEVSKEQFEAAQIGQKFELQD